MAKWAQLEGENFCKPCFKKVFMLRGKYSDVAGSAKKAGEAEGGGGGGSGGAAAEVPAAQAPSASSVAVPPPSALAEASPAKPGAWVPKAAPEGASSAGDTKYGGGKKCAVCSKAVYSAEPKVEAG